MKKPVIFLIVFTLILSISPIQLCCAEELPNAFWNLNDGYAAALSNGDDYAIIDFGKQILELLANEPKTDQVNEILGSRGYEVADAYDRLGDFPSAAYYYQNYIPYGEAMGWTDGVKIAKAKVEQYRPSVTVYTDAVQTQKYFGAINEPEMGVLYGEISEKTNDRESMILLYINYGDMPNDWDYKILDDARRRGAAVEIAWNIQGEGSALSGILNDGEYISSFLNELNKYGDVPMYLRLGAEMNIWGDKPDPQEFKAAFAYVADLVHSQTSHIATVWSVSYASEWNTDMTDFYPGDQYVDWVGISAYMIRHFQGKEWDVRERYNEVVFSAGDAADPVLLVKEVIDKFGDRKPIMLAECGSARRTLSLGTDNSDWAVNHLNRMYWFVPMVYPQVKLIAYFNTYISPEVNDYSLSGSLLNAYSQAVLAPHFIENKFSKTGVKGYRNLTDGMVLAQEENRFYAYPHVYGDDTPSVRYSIDGSYVGEEIDIPYSCTVNLSDFGIGEHTLKAEVISNGSVVAETNYRIYITENISVKVNGNQLVSDTVPMMENDRVLVPMRTIFEALGAEVEWDDATQTATASKDGDWVSIAIDKAELWKNGQRTELDTPARIINNRTMVPVRAVSEALKADVKWEEESQTVSVTR